MRRPEISLEKGEEGGQEVQRASTKSPALPRRGVRPAPKSLCRGGGGEPGWEWWRGRLNGGGGSGRPGEPGGSQSGTRRNSREDKCSEAQRLPSECESTKS